MNWPTLKVNSASLVLGMAAAVVLCAAAGAAWRPAPAPAEQPRKAATPTPPVVAIVNILKVMSNLDEQKEKHDDLDKRRADLKALATKNEADSKAEEARITAMASGPAKTKAIQTYRDKSFHANVEVEYTSRIIAEDSAMLAYTTYKKIDDAATRLAKQNGYQIVMTSDENLAIPAPPQAKLEDIMQIIAIKRMLYTDPALDISEELVTFMNNEFHGGGAAAPAPAKK